MEESKATRHKTKTASEATHGESVAKVESAGSDLARDGETVIAAEASEMCPSESRRISD
jgi:hypothetical protein